ncbi:MAG: hypothetical protein E7J63_21890 [Pantoea sp.]|nr:hypothetical protein [Pantoea sp.]
MVIAVLAVFFKALIAWKAMVIAFMVVAFIWFPWMMLTMVPFRSATRKMLARLDAFNTMEKGSCVSREKACPSTAENVTV